MHRPRAVRGRSCQPGARSGEGGHGEYDSQDHHQAGSHAALPPGKITRLTTARLSKAKNNRTANCKEPRVTIRHRASASQTTAAVPLHHVTPIRKRGSELPGVRVGCQLIDLPRAPSQMANTCAQP